MRTRRSIISLLSLLAGIAVICGPLVTEGYCLELRSDAFADNGNIPRQYTGLGENFSPPMRWTDVPAGTQSFVLIMDDPDAPMGAWIHWVIFDIPAMATTLPENVPKDLVMADGTKQGINSFRWTGYSGPFPPPGPAHHYVFRLYALDTKLDLSAGTNKGTVVRAMQGHILGEARMTGLFKR